MPDGCTGICRNEVLVGGGRGAGIAPEVRNRRKANAYYRHKMQREESEAAAAAARTASHIAPFRPLPWQIAPWRDTSSVVLLEGGAGGGKSRLAAEKIHAFCLKYSGATGLMVRKTREAMSNSTVLQFVRGVVASDPNVVHRPSDHRFEYSNGSIIAYGGMKDEAQRQQLRSIGIRGGLDFIWMEEANAFVESDFNELIPRLRGTAASWRQILLTTNPDSPMHWIYRRLIAGGGAQVYRSMAVDNTYNPEDYVENLKTVTGVEGERLAKGLWTRAEGLVYEGWSSENITEQADYIPDGGSVYWAADDGYVGTIDPLTGTFTANSHPRVFLLAQQRHDGTLCVFYESYKVGEEAGAHVDEVLNLPYPRPLWVALGSSSWALKLPLHNRDINTRNSPSSVDESIKIMRSWVAPDKRNNRRLLYVHPRCFHFCMEMSAYSNDKLTGKPMKEFDHGPDSGRYLIWTLRYEVDI